MHLVNLFKAQHFINFSAKIVCQNYKIIHMCFYPNIEGGVRCSKFLVGGRQKFPGGCPNFFYCVFWTFRGPSPEKFLKFPERKFFQRKLFSMNFFFAFLGDFFRKRPFFGAGGGGALTAVGWFGGCWGEGVLTHQSRGGGPPHTHTPKTPMILFNII